MKQPIVLAVGLVVAVAGCSGKSGNSSAPQSAQSPPPAAVASIVPGSPATSGASSNGNPVTALPVYPGATKLATQFTKPMSFCHRKMMLTVYHVGDAPEKVSNWYESRMPGANTVKIGSLGAGTNGQGATGYFVLDSGGGSAAIVERMHYGSLEKSAQRFGMVATTIALTTYDPPLSPEEMQWFKAGIGTDASAKAQARASLKQKCGSAGLSFGG